MSSQYEFWLTDDAGRRILLLKDFSFASYSRSTRGFGTLLFGLPFESYLRAIPTVFQPDWRIDAWRSPGWEFPKRREGSFFLRKYRIYDRIEDNVRMIEFFGRSPLDILRRWAVSTSTVADYEKTAAIDDMMKAVVRDNFITTPHVAPAGEFSCDGDLALGPVIYQSFPGKNVLDILTDLKATSFSMNAVSSSDRRIFFDVVEGPGVTGGFGYIFRTYADLRGTNRLNGIVFSPENGNLKAPYFYEDYLDEFTEVQVGNTTVTSTDSTLSRWNVCRMYQNIVSSDADVEASEAYKILNDKAKILSLGAQFLSTPGSTDQPRSLYGVDWDLGDLLLCQYAGKNMGAEVEIVWVSVNEEGEENIVGSNRVGVL